MHRYLKLAATLLSAAALTACGNPSNPDPDASVAVEGQVVGLAGQPIPGVQIAIDGSTAVTDTNGEFSVAEVSTPYDALLRGDLDTGSGAQAYLHAFRGLETEQPVLMPLHVIDAGDAGGGWTFATVEGDLPEAVGTDQEALVCVEGDSVDVYGCTTRIGPATTYDREVFWHDASAVSVRVHVLMYDTSGDFPANFQYAVASGNLSRGATTTIDVPSWGSLPGTTNLSGSVSPPSGHQVDEVDLLARVSDTFVMPVASGVDGGNARTFDVEVPDFGESFQVHAAAGSGTRSGSAVWEAGVGAGEDVALSLDTPASWSRPSAGATGVGTDTTFELDNADDTLNTFTFQPEEDDAPLFAVTTLDATASIPDASSLGVALPEGASYTSVAFTTQPATTMADAGTGWIGDYFRLILTMDNAGPGAIDDGTVATSDARAFTTE